MAVELDHKDMPGNTGQQKNIVGTIERLGEVYGLTQVRQYINEYTERLDRVSLLNKQLADMTDEDEEFNLLVQRIMDATQEYYNYIGKLPEDIRQFFLLIMNVTGGSDEPIAEVARIVGVEPASLDTSGLLSVQAIRPQNYIMQIDAITNQLAHYAGEDQMQIRVGKRGSQPIHTTVTLDMPDHMRIEGGEMLSTYDKSIINGVTSLIESGNSVFSIPMLYHAMTGKQNPTVDEALADELAAKLEKMRRMILTIDLTEENEARYFRDENGDQIKIEDLQLEGYLLPLNKVTGKVNGKKAELFQIIQHPPLYTYSKLKRQLATVKISLLDAPINNNATTIPLKTYLLQRIELMKNKRNNVVATTILYESVYQELGAMEANKTKKMRIRTYTCTILQHFVDEGYIKGYCEYKRGRSIAGVDILF